MVIEGTRSQSSNSEHLGKSTAHFFLSQSVFPIRFESPPLFIVYQTSPGIVNPRGVLPGNLVEGMQPATGTVTLFQTKICDFPYPISDLTPISMPYFRPDPYPISFSSTFENFFKFQTMTKSHISEEEH